MTARPRILDIVNTDHAALHFLAFRARWINQHTEFENDVVCSPGPHLPRIDLPAGRITAMDIPRGMAPGSLARFLARLVRHLRAHSYTIVHTHNSITGAIGRIAARAARVPLTIHTTHGFHFHEHMGRLRTLPFLAAERALSRCCDVLLCQSREELALAPRLGLQPRHGVHLVGNGIDLTFFPPRASQPRNPRPVILCVGRLEPVKNQSMLFRALARLRRLRPEHRPLVRLVGDGPSQPAYEAELGRLGLTDTVEFLGYRYDIPALTAAADVVVLTSLKEGIPRALMQASAVGVPVVATDVKGSREVVLDGETGFLVSLGDVAALAERLATLLDDPTLRRDMGVRAVEHAREHFDEARVVERLVQLYRQALRARGLAETVGPLLAAPLRVGQERT
jgi:glycosyltransferase involved in cell wall biosynthesis